MAPELTHRDFRHTVTLKDQRRLIYEFSNGYWHIAFYRLRRPGEVGGNLDAERFRVMHKNGTLPLGRADAYYRTTAKSLSFTSALRFALENSGCAHHYKDICEYLSASPYAIDLGLT